MSNKKPFKAGDKVTTAVGARCVVVVDQHGGQPVHIETAKDVKPYRTTYVPVESLTRGHGRQKPEPAPDLLEAGNYLVPFNHEDELEEAAVLTIYVDTQADLTADAVRSMAEAELDKLDPPLDPERRRGYIAGTPERVQAQA